MTQATDRFDDRAFILNPREWPCGPFLPLRKRGSGRRTLADKTLGVLVNLTKESRQTRDGKPLGAYTVFHVYLFDLPTTVEGWEQAEKTSYDTVEELLADGWEVD